MNKLEQEGQPSRHRAKRACDQCRKRKIRCNGGPTACDKCILANLECSHDNVARKRGPPKGYIQAAESRLTRVITVLGDLLDKNNPKVRSLISELSAPLETASGDIIPIRTSQDDRSSNRSSSSPEQNLMNSSSSMAGDHQEADSSLVAQDKEGRMIKLSGIESFHGSASGFYQLPENLPQVDDFDPPCKKLERIYQHQINPHEIIDRSLSDHLIDVFFHHFHPVFPVLDRPKFMENPYKDMSNAGLLLLNVIYAIAARASEDPRLEAFVDAEEPLITGTVFFKRAKYLLSLENDISRLVTIQALLLYCFFYPDPKNWTYSGIAFRMAVDIGLNRQLPDLSGEEMRIRKRVFWCAFLLDRRIAAAYGRSVSLDEQECDVPHFNEDDEEKPWSSEFSRMFSIPPPSKLSIISNFSQNVLIYEILGRILRALYSPTSLRSIVLNHNPYAVVSSLQNSLTSWLGQLPPRLQLPAEIFKKSASKSPLDPIMYDIHITYNTCLILLHRPFIPTQPWDSSKPNSANIASSLQTCYNAANAILELAYQKSEMGYGIFEPRFYDLYTATAFKHKYRQVLGISFTELRATWEKMLEVIRSAEYWSPAARKSRLSIQRFLQTDEFLGADTNRDNSGNKEAFKQLQNPTAMDSICTAALSSGQPPASETAGVPHALSALSAQAPTIPQPFTPLVSSEPASVSNMLDALLFQSSQQPQRFSLPAQTSIEPSHSITPMMDAPPALDLPSENTINQLNLLHSLWLQMSAAPQPISDNACLTSESRMPVDGEELTGYF
ncbi:uncharacterized protein VTP21DRAFT_8496 [Calcarisporiella thermophila]|uniref:uncharacterized protein n=1 Tax=Calcarisporiella thermophila TaxID=911321 RepID=UPI0037422BD5